ncbi:MAG: hypothetical protein CFH15_01241 [Alphaproteobacteria bacterium MarineAlpha5_Bin5]|nr:MAG: hypothetical protein CFH15_01241 [Alphaproteobacteria bacterium MarineAlpha5_Bin5]PPR51685.1 MAG: hypothetical protein CFH14_00636 [Alphaproteobacteria bacterium MarineAlpha5_Bin4]|tara:strand:+ start:6615 stop:6755 length:141 start_codon:yes stop_codon:yes gene_type:complete
MDFTSQTLLLYLVLGIFLFCYFLATWVWIKVDEKNSDEKYQKDQDN